MMRPILSLLFFGALASAQTIYIAGDSTANKADREGWGDYLAEHVNAGKATVENRAKAGRSARTFTEEGLWAGIVASLKPGDFVLIQFGHNDGGPPDKDRARGDLPGTGEEAREFTMPDGQTKMVRTFGWYVRQMIRETKRKGATPVVLSLTVRNIWKDGRVERGSGHFAEWSADVAREEGAAVVDVTTLLADEYERMGEELVKPLFPVDHTHTSQEGARKVAGVIAGGLHGVPALAAIIR